MEIIKLNLIPSGVNPTCHCSQYDNGRVIRIDLFDGLTPYVLQSGDTVTLNVRKPDNTIVTASVTATQGNTYVNIVTTEQICACVGYNLCDLTITNGSKVIGTLNFIMQVERDVLADGIPSQSVIEDLDALVEEAVGDNYYTKTETDAALDLKANVNDVENIGDQVDNLEDVVINGFDNTFIGYYDNNGSGIGGNIYKSSKLKLEKGFILSKIRIYCGTTSNDAIIFLVNDYGKIVKKIIIAASDLQNGWNEINVNNYFVKENTYIAVSGGSIRYSYSLASKDNYYSDGLYECSATYSSSNVGDFLTFAHNVPERYYEFAVEVDYHIPSIQENINTIDYLLDNVTGKVLLTDFTMPKVRDTSEEGYTLLGKWFSFSTYDECAKCGGQSIIFKVKNATNVVVDIKQIIHPSHPDFVMSVEPYIAYSVDGGNFNRAQINSDPSDNGITITIPTTDEHFVWIVIDGMCLNSGSANRNSGWSGIYIKSITTDGKLYKVDPKCRQILFVGDSIVEGINTIGTTSTSESNSAVNEFSFKTARKLNSIPLLQGFGGTTANGGISHERYSWVDGQQNKYILCNPDVILVEYGYNDANSGYTTEQFKEYYNTLLDLLESHYSGTPIICLIPFKQSFAQTIRELSEARSYCYCVETSDYTVTYSDNAHPNALGAESIANSLSADIIKILTKEFFI